MRSMYRLPNPRHAFAGGPRAAGPHPTCPKGQVLKCHVSSSEGVICKCEAVKTGPIVAGEPDPLGLTAPSPSVYDELSCPRGYDLECFGDAAGGWVCYCVGAQDMTSPTIDPSARSRSLKANPHRPGHRKKPSRYHRLTRALRLKKGTFASHARRPAPARRADNPHEPGHSENNPVEWVLGGRPIAVMQTGYHLAPDLSMMGMGMSPAFNYWQARRSARRSRRTGRR